MGGPTSPGPVRSPTDISLAHLTHIPSHQDSGEGTSSATTASGADGTAAVNIATVGLGLEHHSQPPPEYTSPESSDAGDRRRGSGGSEDSDSAPLIMSQPGPPIPSYSDAVAGDSGRGSSGGEENGTS